MALPEWITANTPHVERTYLFTNPRTGDRAEVVIRVDFDKLAAEVQRAMLRTSGNPVTRAAGAIKARTARVIPAGRPY